MHQRWHRGDGVAIEGRLAFLEDVCSTCAQTQSNTLKCACVSMIKRLWPGIVSVRFCQVVEGHVAKCEYHYLLLGEFKTLASKFRLRVMVSPMSAPYSAHFEMGRVISGE